MTAPQDRKTSNLPTVARVIEVLREESLRTFCMKVLGELGYRRLLVLARELAEPIHDQSARIPITIDLLQKHEVPDYVAFRVEAENDEVLQRLDDGHICFVVRHEGRIVHASWIGENYAYTSYLRLPIPVLPGDIYGYDDFTHPDYRGFNISPARTIYAFKFMRQAGYKRIVVTTLPDNYRARRTFEKTHFQIVALIGYVKIGPWRKDFCHYRKLVNASNRSSHENEIHA